MKKLNSKGFTTIEVILCFVLITIIATTMYTTITSFNQKRITEQYKSKMYTYKNIITKQIQDDILKNGLLSVEKKPLYVNSDKISIQEVKLNFKDGSSKTLIIEFRHTKSDYHPGSTVTNKDDYYMIKYGGSNQIKYPLPELGESKSSTGQIVKDLSISNVKITTNNNVFALFIGLYHPELGYRYSIRIVSPINYIDTGSANSETV